MRCVLRSTRARMPSNSLPPAASLHSSKLWPRIQRSVAETKVARRRSWFSSEAPVHWSPGGAVDWWDWDYSIYSGVNIDLVYLCLSANSLQSLQYCLFFYNMSICLLRVWSILMLGNVLDISEGWRSGCGNLVIQRCVAQKLERSSALHHRKMSLHILHEPIPSCTSCKSAKPVTRLQDGVECLQLILAPFPENIEGIVRLDLRGEMMAAGRWHQRFKNQKRQAINITLCWAECWRNCWWCWR